MKDRAEGKLKTAMDGVRNVWYSGFKKKGGRSNIPTGKADLFRGYPFQVGRDGPKSYDKTVEQLALYLSTHFKNGSDVVVFL